MTTLKEGDKAPDFTAPIQDESTVSLSDYAGKKLILYFYPKDMTPGCTTEANNLKEHYALLQDKGFEVLGVSPDDAQRHIKFIMKHDLPFPLLADTEKEVAKAYGVWGEKSMYGRKYMGIFRTTFVIDEEGTILKVIKKVKTKEHAQQILRELGME